MPSEFQLIQKIQKLIQQQSDEVVCGIGDDAAVVKGREGYYSLYSVDAFVDQVHFDLHYFSLEEVGAKAMAASLSDIAAMGGRGLFVLVSLGLPVGFSEEEIGRLYQGFESITQPHQISIIGGNITKNPEGLFIDIVSIGEVEQAHLKTRQSASPGDLICVSGPLGSAALGLAELEKDPGIMSYFTQKQKLPWAQLELGEWLSAQSEVTSLMDISDGLVGDLGHLLEQSQVGARIQTEQVPLEEGLMEASMDLGLNPLDLILSGGEDYQLLFTVRALEFEAFEKKADKEDWPIYPIGIIEEYSRGLQIFVEDQKIDYRKTGHDHFC